MGIFEGLLNSATSIWQTNESENMMREQQSFETGMADTAHTREVRDLKAAGLNPMLSAMRGGAPMPSAGGMPTVQNPGEAFLAGSAQGEQVKKLQAETENVKADTLVKLEQSPWWKQQTATSTQEMWRLVAAREQALAEVNRVRAEAKRIEGETEASAFYRTHIQPAEAALANTEADLAELRRPEASAMAESWKGAYGKNVRPFLKDFGEVTGGVASAAQAGAAARFLGRGIEPNSRGGFRAPRSAFNERSMRGR